MSECLGWRIEGRAEDEVKESHGTLEITVRLSAPYYISVKLFSFSTLRKHANHLMYESRVGLSCVQSLSPSWSTLANAPGTRQEGNPDEPPEKGAEDGV